MRIAAAIVAFIGITTAAVLRDIPHRNVAEAGRNASYPSGCGPLCTSGCSTAPSFVTIPSIIPPLTAPFSTTPHPTSLPPSCGDEPTGSHSHWSRTGFPTGTLNHTMPTAHYPTPSQPTTALSSDRSVSSSGTPYDSAPNPSAGDAVQRDIARADPTPGL